MRCGRLPVPGGFRRKLVVGLLVLVLLPGLPAVALMASTAIVDTIGHLVAMLWPWVVAPVVIVGLWRLVARRR